MTKIGKSLAWLLAAFLNLIGITIKIDGEPLGGFEPKSMTFGGSFSFPRIR